MKIRLALLFAAAFAAQSYAADFTVAPLKYSGIYAVGEELGWTITAAQGVTPKTTYSYVVRSNGATEIEHGTFDLSKSSARIALTLDHPQMVTVTIDKTGAPPPNRTSMVIASG